MAAIHPSRMGLIQPALRETRNRNDDYHAPAAPRRRSPSPARKRHSPDYGEYTDRGRPIHGHGGDPLEERRIRRETLQVDVWPPSPKAPTRALSPKPKGKKRSKRARSLSVSSSDYSSSEEEDRRRRKRRKEKKKHRSKHKTHEPEQRKRTRTTSPLARSPSPEEWIEKPSSHHHAHAHHAQPSHTHDHQPPRSPSAEEYEDEEDDDDDVGPRPAGAPTKSRKVDERAYGTSLLRGEGSAMAAFLQGESGTDARIPRRGEIGLNSDQIAQYEVAGYVMSGSRHHRMNAVRMRKENQVISAEEKRGMLKLQKEEKERREAILREEFSDLVSENLKKGGQKSDDGAEK